MKHIQAILIIIFSILVFFSCTKEILFDGTLLEPKLVVNSICMLDSAITVDVSESKPIPGFETDYRMVTDAMVMLFVDGAETEQLVYDSVNKSSQNMVDIPQSARYKGNTVIEKGRHYKIEVGESRYPQIASGEMTMNGKIQIENVDTTITLFLSDYSGLRQKVKASVRFTDPGNERNYYRLVTSYRVGRDQSYVNGTGDTVKMVQVMDYIYSNSGIESDDPVFATDENADEMLFGSNNNRYTIFTDDIFNGKTYNLKFNLDENITYYFQEMDTDLYDFYVITVELQSLSHDVYNYMKSLSLSYANSSGLFMEPVQIYNNIENGLGIFGGCSSSQLSVKKGNYPVNGIQYYYGSASF